MAFTRAQRAVADALIAYGRELDASGAAQVGSSFTGSAAADELLRRDANALLLGLLFTQGIPAERAWSAPWHLRERLGRLDPEYLATHSDEVRAAVQAPPMLHRFKETLPRWIVSAAQILCAEYGGDASRIWSSGSSVAEVVARLSSIPGIGRKKAVMAAAILTRHLGVPLTGPEGGQVAYDVHVRRVFLRSGLAAHDTLAGIERAAAEALPESPATLDLAAWLIGRETCRPVAPACDRCRLGAVCPRLVERTPQGVGARRARAG